jgi:hypothetical protein
MKLLLALILIFFFTNGVAQSIPKGKFTTKIEKANTVYNKGGVTVSNAKVVNIYQNKTDTVYITKRDTVFVEKKEEKIKVAEAIIDLSKPDKKLYVVGVTQKMDTSGLYVTTIEFGNIGGGTITGVDIAVRFNTAYESYHWGGFSIGMNIVDGRHSDRMGVFYRAGMLQSNRTITLTVTSREQLFASIIGVSGTYN